MGDRIVNYGNAGVVGTVHGSVKISGGQFQNKTPKPKQKIEKYALVMQEWEESEAGWGIRPDGYSFHLTEEDCKEYAKEYWNGMPKGSVPHEYSRESGSPVWVTVSEAFYKEVKKANKQGRKGYRVWNSDGKVIVSKTGERQWEERGDK